MPLYCIEDNLDGTKNVTFVVSSSMAKAIQDWKSAKFLAATTMITNNGKYNPGIPDPEAIEIVCGDENLIISGCAVINTTLPAYSPSDLGTPAPTGSIDFGTSALPKQRANL